ncbi:MAG: ATP-binding cassette domain-containing protein [Planctomycetota bacterium]
MIADGTTQAVLAFRDVRKRFTGRGRSVEALRDISLDVPAGRITGLVGPDAAGKTTLIRLAAALLVADAGNVEVLGHDAADEALAVQSSVGYMPQRFGLYEDLTVRQNLDLYADLQGVGSEARGERFERLLTMASLTDVTGRLAGRLSGGMKQKLAVCCAMIGQPELLLLDEPTVGVDPLSRRELWRILRGLVDDEGVTVLLSTAYLEEAQRCDTVAVLHTGELLASGAPGRFIDDVRGRTWAATSSRTDRLALAMTLADEPLVADAVAHGHQVRVLAAADAPEDVDRRLAERMEGVRLGRVEPTFEEAFLALLASRRRRGGRERRRADLVRLKDVDGRDPVIVAEGLTKRFGHFTAVDHVSLEVRPGEIFGLLGPNGAGKSTAFRMLCGLSRPSDGRARVAGWDMRRCPERAQERMGYMSQTFSLYGQLTAGENLRFFARVYGLSRREVGETIDRMVDVFGLGEFFQTPAGLLPLGFKQRLSMACAVMHEPDVLFLDEPTSGVDPLARREFWTHITAMARAGVAVMVTTHVMSEADYCDRLAILRAGRILRMGTPDDIRRAAGGREGTIEEAFVALIQRGAEGQEAKA